MNKRNLNARVNFSLIALLAFVSPQIAFAADTAATAMRTVSPGKSNLGVDLRYSLSAAAGSSEPNVLTVMTTSRPALNPASITFRAGEGLSLSSDDVIPGQAQPLGATNTFVLRVTPVGAGIHYVNVFIQTDTRRRALAIAVPAAGGALSPVASPPLKSPPSGDRVIAVPAQ